MNAALRSTSATNPGGNKCFLVKHARLVKLRNRQGSYNLSLAHRRTEAVMAILQEFVKSGKSSFRPGDVNSVMRERGSPVGTWEMRAEFTGLEKAGRIACDPDTGMWQLTEKASLKNAG